MTHLIIHPENTLRREYLLSQVNKLIDKEYTQITQLMTNPDIHIVEHPEHNSISIADVKQLQKEMIFRPFQERYQIGIIFYADNLTIEAQNALLKTLEEQSATTVYFLMIANEQNLLDTIISRGIKHYVKNLHVHQAKSKEDQLAAPDILQMDLTEKFKLIEDLVNQEKEDRLTIKNFINGLTEYFRQEMLAAMRDGNPTSQNSYKKILSEIEESNQRISANVNKRLALENLMLIINSELS